MNCEITADTMKIPASTPSVEASGIETARETDLTGEATLRVVHWAGARMGMSDATIIVWDLETVPDLKAAARILGIEFESAE